jgi:pimeloyl-ACP methyl ester carboxylesterase
MSGDALALRQSGGGIPLVFVHGLGADGRIWTPFIEALAGEFHCAAVDLPGHGESADPPEIAAYEFPAIAACMHRALQQAGIARPIVVGHSIGAVVASFYAAEYPVRALVIIDQPLDIRERARIVQSVQDMLRGPDFPLAWQKVRATFGLEHLPEAAGKLEANMPLPRQSVVLRFWDGLLTRPPDAYQDHIDGYLRSIRAPCTVLSGLMPDAQYRDWLKQRMPQTEFAETGVPCHFPHLVAPERLISIIRAAV